MLCGDDLLARHLGDFGVVAGLGQQVARSGQIGFAPLVGPQALHQRRCLGLFSRHRAVARDVLAQLGVAQVCIELGQPHGQALQLKSKGISHGRESGTPDRMADGAPAGQLAGVVRRWVAWGLAQEQA